MNKQKLELFHDLLSMGALTWPNSTIVSDRDDALTYNQMHQRSQFAADWLNTAGIKSGDRVIVWLPKSIDAATMIFSPSYANAVVIPVNPLLKPKQVRHIIEDSGARAVISCKSLLSSFEIEEPIALRKMHIFCIDQLRPQLDDARLNGSLHREKPRRSAPESVAAILYTSGSTGPPKGVVLSHDNLIAGATCVAGYLNNQASDVMLGVLPLSFDAGLSQLTTAMKVGARVHLFDYFLPSDVLTVIKDKAITGVTAVPTFWNAIADHLRRTGRQVRLRYIANTGGAMPIETTKLIRSSMPDTDVFLMYGFTEAFRSTFLPPQYVDSHPKSIGKAVPGAKVLVVRKDGEACAPFEHGEIVHQGPTVALGYWQRELQTAEKFRPLNTATTEFGKTVWSGDTAYTDNDGFVYFVGRDDDMIKVSGYRVSPTEIEECAMSTGRIAQCAAVAVSHPRHEQAILLFVSPRIGDKELDERDNSQEDLLAAIETKLVRYLPRYMQPSEIIVAKDLPYNSNGKVDRQELKQKFAEHFGGS